MKVRYAVHVRRYRDVDPVAHLRGCLLSSIRRPFRAIVSNQIMVAKLLTSCIYVCWLDASVRETYVVYLNDFDAARTSSTMSPHEPR
jgi:hypothetical protein